MKKAIRFILVLIFSTNLFAEVWVPRGQMSKPPSDTFTLDFGVNQYNKDYYLYLAPGMHMDFSRFGFSLQVPLNILVKDNYPKIEGSAGKQGQLRQGDYDNKSDFQRIINYVWFGKFGEYKPGEITYSAFLGKMNDGYIGHGTIIDRYVNNQRIDTYKLGVMADVNTDYGGVQVFTNSVYDRDVNAGRAYIRPFGILRKVYNVARGGSLIGMMTVHGSGDATGRKKVYQDLEDEPNTTNRKTNIENPNPNTKNEPTKNENPQPEKEVVVIDESPSYWNRFAIGYTYAYDGRSPYELKYDTTGNAYFDKYNNPEIKTTKRLAIEGYDVEFKVYSSDWLEITPYADQNKIRGIPNSVGNHGGVLFKVGGRNINATFKPEYRKMSSNYIPIYFDSFYEIERFNYDLSAEVPYTKYKHLEKVNKEEYRWLKGYYHSLVVNIYRMGFEAAYEDYDGKDNSRVFVGAYIPIFDIIKISGYYTKKGFNDKKDTFKLDDKAMGIGELAIALGPITIKGQVRRRWIMDKESGQFIAQDEKMIYFSGGSKF